MDIKSFFDEVDHELLMKALEKHVGEKWVKMYIQRWLESPIQTQEGLQQFKTGQGTPQGGVISPLLSNLYLHYTLDQWLTIHYPEVAFVRYADDVVLHCKSEKEAKDLLEQVRERLTACKLRLNETKTQLVHCRDYRRKEKKDYKTKFGFLGFDFQPRILRSKRKEGYVFLGYKCSMSTEVQRRVVERWKKEDWHRRSDLSIQKLASRVNLQMRGLINYFGKIHLRGLHKVVKALHSRLLKWAMNKYRPLRRNYRKALEWLRETQQSYPNMFYHWTIYHWV